jgi:xanthine dehydrogenase molybdopterin-binding subunit B
MSCLQNFYLCKLLHPFVFQDIPGIIAFLTAKDIPGKNSFVPVPLVFLNEDEEVSWLGSYKSRW